MAAGSRQWGKVCARKRAQRLPCWLHKYGLCKYNGAPIRYDLRWPHPESFSGDHIIPTSQGGQDTDENCGSSHLRCNTARHDDPVESLELTTTRDW